MTAAELFAVVYVAVFAATESDRFVAWLLSKWEERRAPSTAADRDLSPAVGFVWYPPESADAEEDRRAKSRRPAR